jgi:hypothetical protein
MAALYDVKFWHLLARRKTAHDIHHREHVVVIRDHGISIMSDRMAKATGAKIVKEEITTMIRAAQPVVIAGDKVGVNHRTNHQY